MFTVSDSKQCLTLSLSPKPSLCCTWQHPWNRTLQGSQRLQRSMFLLKLLVFWFPVIFICSSLKRFLLQISEPYGIKIFKIPSPIFFANIDFFKDRLIEAVSTRHIVPICVWVCVYIVHVVEFRLGLGFLTRLQRLTHQLEPTCLDSINDVISYDAVVFCAGWI